MKMIDNKAVLLECFSAVFIFAFQMLPHVALTHRPFPPAVAHPVFKCLNGVFASGSAVTTGLDQGATNW